MRWYGPQDPVSLAHIRQAGAAGVVTALHQVPVGEVWSLGDIWARKAQVEAAGMSWTVIESLPVHEDIKRRRGDYARYIANYQQSLRHVAACGLEVVTYNFMPVLDWVRTHPAHTPTNGAKTLRYEKVAFIAFEVFLLQRPGAEAAYSDEELARAKDYLARLSEAERDQLFRNLLLGLPGSDVPFTPEGVLQALETYAEIDAAQLRQNLFRFLEAVVPVAEELGVKLAIHPDDPPYPVLGLPRVVSTEADARAILAAVASPANGLCFCTGSYGARPDNDVPGMLRRLGDRVHFLHLRNTRRDAEGNFEEAEHLAGDTDMVAVVREVLQLQQRRQIALPMRPDHGFQMLDDLQKTTYPGYSAIGRLKGLAELRGLELGLAAQG